MLDPVVEFVTRMFALLGRGIGRIIAWIFLPFVWIKNLYKRTHGHSESSFCRSAAVHHYSLHLVFMERIVDQEFRS